MSPNIILTTVFFTLFPYDARIFRVLCMGRITLPPQKKRRARSRALAGAARRGLRHSAERLRRRLIDDAPATGAGEKTGLCARTVPASSSRFPTPFTTALTPRGGGWKTLEISPLNTGTVRGKIWKTYRRRGRLWRSSPLHPPVAYYPFRNGEYEDQRRYASRGHGTRSDLQIRQIRKLRSDPDPHLCTDEKTDPNASASPVAPHSHG